MRAKSVALVVGLLAVGTIPLVLSVTADAAPDSLLTRSRPVLASSTKSATFAAARAVDGDATTAWTSGDAAGSQWLRIDLGRSRAVTRVRIGWTAAYARAYRVQLSNDGATWTDAYRTAAGDGGADDVKRISATGRYVRVLATRKARASGYGISDLRVYGPGAAARTESLSLATGVPPAAAALTAARKRDVAFQLVSSAENSSVEWRKQFGYIEDIGDGRGYTAGIIGFCSGTSDMLAVVTEYTRRSPRNKLARFLPALRAVDGSDSHAGLDPGFTTAWRAAAADPVFQKVQEDERDRMYFNPAVTTATTDGLRALGQFAYYDAAVMHGMSGLRSIRAAALRHAQPPKQGGDEITWLSAFLDARVTEMRKEEAHSDVSRVQTAQRAFLRNANLDLNAPLSWSVYGDPFRVVK